MTPPETRSAARKESQQRAKRIKVYSSVCCAVLVIGAAVAVVVVQPWVTRPGCTQPTR